MDRRIRVRFYELVGSEGGKKSVEAILRALNGEADKRKRQAEVAEDCTLRLEYLEEANDLLIGDLTRVQTENFPTEVTDQDVAKLQAERLGHHVAFCYDPETHVAAFQFHPMSVSIGRFCLYLARFGGDDAGFAPLPVLQKGAWEKFATQTPRKLTVGVGRVENFKKMQPDSTPFEDQIVDMANRYDAPSIEVTVTARRQGRLKEEEVKSTVKRWLQLAQNIKGIRKIKAETLEAEDAFNFLKELLQEKTTMKFPADPVAARVERMKYARKCYDLHRKYLKETYAAPNGT